MDDKVRAQYAHNILENPVFQAAIDVIRSETVQAWADCPARDLEGKEQLWKLYRVNEKFLNIFKGYVESGKLADLHEKQEQSSLRNVQDKVTKFFRR